MYGRKRLCAGVSPHNIAGPERHMNEVPTGIDFDEALLGWIRQRPHMYALHAGELNGVLHYLHVAWAKVKNREADLDVALREAEVTAAGLLPASERVHAVQLGTPATDRVLEFWARVDLLLNLKHWA